MSGGEECEDATIGLQEVAAALKCSTKTVQRMVRAGELPAPRVVARRPLWLRSTIRRWLDQTGEPPEGTDQ